MTCTEKYSILDNEVVGSLKPIRANGPFSLSEETGYRDIETDIKRFNEIVKNEKTVADILHQSNEFLQRQFGNLITQEIFMRSRPKEKPELMSKSRCRCGNMVVAALKALVEGSLTNCGCKTPLPEKYAKNISVYQSEQPTRWTTTVDGIQWLGLRYMWFVTLFVRGVCVLRKYTGDTHEALRIRRDAEVKYYGRSDINKFENAMYLELEQLRRVYLSKCPPKVEGIYKCGNLWNARLWHRNKLVLNKSFPDRSDAVKARLKAEKKHFGAPVMAERYYI